MADNGTTVPLGLNDGPGPREAPNPEPLLLLEAPKPETMVDADTGILIDALPYIDMQYNDDNMQAAVDALITDEMVASMKTPDDFLDDLKLPDHKVKWESPFLQSQWDNIKQGEITTPLDRSKYQVPPPPADKRDDLEAWQTAVDNAHAQLETQYLRLVNLDLLSKYGPNAWLTHGNDLEAIVTKKKTELEDSRQAIENLNRKRKAAQLAAGDKLRALEGKFHKYVRKTNEMEAACFVLEREVTRLRKRAKKAGILKEGDKTGTKRFLPASGGMMDTTS